MNFIQILLIVLVAVLAILALIIQSIQEYDICFGDTEAVLPTLADIIDAEYESGNFSKAEDQFCKSGISSEEWIMKGRAGIVVTVLFEQYEGYLFMNICGRGKAYHAAKVYLYEMYLKQNGNPEAQEKP